LKEPRKKYKVDVGSGLEISLKKFIINFKKSMLEPIPPIIPMGLGIGEDIESRERLLEGKMKEYPQMSYTMLSKIIELRIKKIYKDHCS